MNSWLLRLAFLGLLVAAVFAVISAVEWVFGSGRSDGKRSRLSLAITVLFGMEGLLYISGVFLFFALGLGLADTAADAFWPQYNPPAWTRLAGGFASLVGFLLAVKLLKKVLRRPSTLEKS
jgi:hypothetical protein